MFLIYVQFKDPSCISEYNHFDVSPLVLSIFLATIGLIFNVKKSKEKLEEYLFYNRTHYQLEYGKYISIYFLHLTTDVFQNISVIQGNSHYKSLGLKPSRQK